MRGEIPDKPLVVLDLNWIQALPRSAEYLSNRNCYVLMPTVLRELASRPDRRRRGDFDKLVRMLSINRHRVFVAHQVNVLIEDEIQNQCPTGYHNIIDWKFTRTLRESMDGTDSDLPQTISEQLARLIGDIETRRKRFWLALVGTSRFGTETPQVSEPEFTDITTMQFLVHSDAAWTFWDDFCQFLNGPETRRETDPIPMPERLRSANPPSILERFVRVLYYVRIKLTANRTSGMENDYDDMNYAVIASITGHLWTMDRRLAHMIRVCFPKTTIFDGRINSTITHLASGTHP